MAIGNTVYKLTSSMSPFHFGVLPFFKSCVSFYVVIMALEFRGLLVWCSENFALRKRSEKLCFKVVLTKVL